MPGVVDSPTDQLLAGQRVAFTGRLASMTREHAAGVVKSRGGTVVSAISGRTTMLVVGLYGWPLRRDGGISVKVEQAERLRERGGSIRIVSEDLFAELAGLRQPEPSVRKAYSIDHVAQVVRVPAAVIAGWEHLGLVRSDEHGDYDFQDIVSLQTIASLVRSGARPDQIRRSLTRLAAVMPGTDRPLAQLHIVASDSGELLAQVGDALIATDGQQIFDFDQQASAIEVEPRPMAPPSSADEFFDAGLALEEQERYDEAADAYRQVIALAPGRFEAYFNLGNVVRMMGSCEGAAELYRLALAIDEQSELAWYNLADVLEETGRDQDAAECLTRAVAIAPAFADAHFNLALCLARVGERDGARRHWQRYLQLDPESDWSHIARSHLARLGNR